MRLDQTSSEGGFTGENSIAVMVTECNGFDAIQAMQMSEYNEDLVSQSIAILDTFCSSENLELEQVQSPADSATDAAFKI